MKGGISVKALLLWELGLAVAAGGLVFFLLYLLVPRTWLWYSLLWIVGFCYVFFSFLYLPLLHLSCQYETTAAFVEYRGGLIFFMRKQMLRRSIMYVTLIRSPISYLLNTRSIIVHSMGGELVIPWLPSQEAEKLLSDLSPCLSEKALPAENREMPL